MTEPVKETPTIDPEESGGEMLARLGMDADLWARELCKRNPILDVDTTRAWLANAIMAGFDESARLALAECGASHEAIGRATYETISKLEAAMREKDARIKELEAMLLKEGK